MKINVDEPIRLLDWNILMENGEEVTLKKVFIAALLNPVPSGPPPGEEAFRRFKIAQVIDIGGEVDLKVDEATLLKTLVAMHFTPLVVGRVYEMLDG